MPVHRNAAVTGFLLLLIVAAGLALTPVTRPLDERLLDRQFRVLRAQGPRPSALRVTLVGIDEETFRGYREPVALWHPHLGRLFAALAAGRPAAVGLDLVLPDKSYDFLAPGYDRALLTGLLALKAAAPVVLAQTVDERGLLRPLYAPIVSVAGQDPLGLVVVAEEPDRTVRRYEAAVSTQAGDLPTLAGRLGERLALPPGAGIIDYAVGEPFDYVSMQQVIAWHASGDEAALRARLEGAVVLVGAILPFEDRHLLPVALAAWEPANRLLPGVLVHAQALRSLAAGGLVQPAERRLVLLLAALASLVWWFARRPLPGVIAAVIAAAALLGASTLALRAGAHLPVAGALIAVLLALGGRLALESTRAFRDRLRMRSSFGSYVSPGVMEEILAGRLEPGIGGERRRVCVLFSDIRSFTTRSESQPPEAIIALLNDYFDEMTACVHRHDGTVDKFIGDGLMCFFGAPRGSAAPARDAFEAAQEMLARLQTLNEDFAARGIEPVQIGIGLHVGDAVVGHVGSATRHEYTVIGDTVNISARLEGLTKGLGYPIVCTAEVLAELPAGAGLVDLGPQAVKGRAAVHVYGWRKERLEAVTDGEDQA